MTIDELLGPDESAAINAIERIVADDSMPMPDKRRRLIEISRHLKKRKSESDLIQVAVGPEGLPALEVIDSIAADPNLPGIIKKARLKKIDQRLAEALGQVFRKKDEMNL
jgi:uncharacterized protein (UPF0147 family)